MIRSARDFFFVPNFMKKFLLMITNRNHKIEVNLLPVKKVFAVANLIPMFSSFSFYAFNLIVGRVGNIGLTKDMKGVFRQGDNVVWYLKRGHIKRHRLQGTGDFFDIDQES